MSNIGPPDPRDPIDLRLPAKASSARDARVALRDVAGPLLPPDRLDDALLAVSEAINNVVLHAYGESPAGPQQVAVRISAREGIVEVVVTDTGAGFTEGDRAPASGLGAGLRLIEALADEARVFSDTAGTVVVMRFGPALESVSPLPTPDP
jgi:serine/threonine-protein kinase RsbW